MRLQVSGGLARGTNDGIWEISNVDRLGSSELEQACAVAQGCRKLIEMENRLEYGDGVPASLESDNNINAEQFPDTQSDPTIEAIREHIRAGFDEAVSSDILD